jgi:hypothetical protein
MVRLPLYPRHRRDCEASENVSSTTYDVFLDWKEKRLKQGHEEKRRIETDTWLSITLLLLIVTLTLFGKGSTAPPALRDPPSPRQYPLT